MAINNTPLTSSLSSADKLAADATSLTDLKRAANQNTPAAIKETAKQFEAMFVGMMLKSMRKATPDGPMDSEQSKMFTGMLDEQMSQKIASRGLGLADMLVKQMMVNAGFQNPAQLSTSQPSPVGSTTPLVSNPINDHARQLRADNPSLSSSDAQVQAFQQKLGGSAEAASAATGIPANFMIGQAALETGWGKHQIMASNGQPSHNLFNIKAGGDWTGKTISAVTTEYVNGVATQKVEKFRAYDNYDQSFNDYAKLLQTQPRYKNVIANAKDAYGFAQGLQNAGYATDPAYANKLVNVIAKTNTGNMT